MHISVKDLIDNFDCELICGDIDIVCKTFSIDTRSINDCDCFIALKGENVDGSIYYKDAFDKGCKVVILNRDSYLEIEDKIETILLVDDTLEFLTLLAKYRRSLYKNPVIAVTGSVGKTSTKEMIYNVLSEKYNVLKSEKNYNNILGLCLTILNLKNEDILLVELGMNQRGEISKLSKIVKPNIGIITNIGTAHIGNLGSKENILKAKLEILDGMNEFGNLIINYDDEYLNNISFCNIISYSIDHDSEYKANSLEFNNNGINLEVLDEKYFIPVFQKSYIYNTLVSIILGKRFNLTNFQIQNGLTKYKVPNGRGNVIISNSGIKIIDDTYNASLESILSSIEVLERQNEKKVLVIGDILEIGEYRTSIYKEIGNKINDSNVDVLITIGDNKIISDISSKENYHFNVIEEAKEFLIKYLSNKDVVLLKASHGANFKELVNFIEKEI